MAKIKLTKSVVATAQAQARDVELRDTVVPGFLCKITPAGRKVFMVQYHTNSGVRRKPALGQFGELTVEQARVLAQDWLAEVRRGGDPGRAKTEARSAGIGFLHDVVRCLARVYPAPHIALQRLPRIGKELGEALVDGINHGRWQTEVQLPYARAVLCGKHSHNSDRGRRTGVSKGYF